MPLRLRFARAANRRALFVTFLACEAAVIGIPIVDGLLPPDIELLPLNAVPVLIGSGLLPNPGAAILTATAALAQIGTGYLGHGSPITVLISVATVVTVSLVVRPMRKHQAHSDPRHGRLNAGGIPKLMDQLSPREREIVLLTLDGCTAPRIASSLFISRRTVETHLANAYRKMGIGSKVELLRRRSEVTGTDEPLAGPSNTSSDGTTVLMNRSNYRRRRGDTFGLRARAR